MPQSGLRRHELQMNRALAAITATADEADSVVLAFDPPPTGHRDWLTVDLPGL